MWRVLLILALLILGAAATDLMRQHGWIGGSAVYITTGWAGACGVILGRLWRRHQE